MGLKKFAGQNATQDILIWGSCKSSEDAQLSQKRVVADPHQTSGIRDQLLYAKRLHS